MSLSKKIGGFSLDVRNGFTIARNLHLFNLLSVNDDAEQTLEHDLTIMFEQISLQDQVNFFVFFFIVEDKLSRLIFSFFI